MFATSYFSVSAMVRDNVGVVFVTATARKSRAPGLAPGTHVEGLQMSLDSGNNNTTQSGRWTGRIPIFEETGGGQLRINFYILCIWKLD